MEHKVVMIKAPIMKRVCAFIIDFFIFICFSFIISSLITPAMDLFPNVKEDKNAYVTLALESGIYTGDNYETIDYINENYDQAITAFYIKYDNLENYHELKETTYKEYFTFDEQTSTYTPTKSDSEMSQVYLNIMMYQCEEILENNDQYKDLRARLASYEITNFLISFALGSAICYLLFPLIFKNGQTLSKKLLQLQVVSTNENYRLSVIKLICRSLILLFIEILLGILTFGIIPLASLIALIMTRNGTSIHDFIVGTAVVDLTLYPTNDNELKQIVLISYDSEEKELFDGIK